MKMNMLRLIGAETVDLPILGADASGPFVLKSAEGLGPPEINVRMARTVLEGGHYQGKSSALRQINALIALQPNWDEGQAPEDLRSTLYSLLTPKFGGMVRAEIVYNGVVQGYAQGQISKMETALFSKDPAVLLTLECDSPYFLAPSFVVQTPVKTLVSGQTSFVVVNEGTAPAGFVMEGILRAPGGSQFILSDNYPFGEKIWVDGITWNNGDAFRINTRAGQRGIWRSVGGGPFVSILNNLNAATTTWLQLHGGDNTLKLNTTAFDWQSFNFSHTPAFWGV